MLLKPIYENGFISFSHGFRPGRSAHGALYALRGAIMDKRLRWVIDIGKFFDTLQHHHLRDFLDQRVTDGIVRRMINKWLKAGVLEKGVLHHVLDEWWAKEVWPRLWGDGFLVRYADDCVP